MSKHTKGGLWKSKEWDSINVAIVPANAKNGMIIALAQKPGVGGPVSDIERAANRYHELCAILDKYEGNC